MNCMKMMLKKLLCLIAIFFAFSINQAICAPADDFTDTHQGYWSYDAIMALKKIGVLAGYPDGSFRPDEKVTRAEFTAMLTKALGLRDAKDFSITIYKDLSPKHWAYRDIQIASHYGVMEGTPEHNFMANGNVKRVEVIATIMSALNLKELTPDEAMGYLKAAYSDVDELPAWALTRTGKAEQLHAIVVRPWEEGLLMPNRAATRGELAVFLYNMRERVKIHPSKKLQGALPKRVDGYVLENAYLDGNMAIIPAGTVLPLGVMDCVWSKEAKVGDEFIARTLVNFVTKDKVLLIPIGKEIKGTIQKAKKGTTLIKNAQMVFQTQTLLDDDSRDTGVEFVTVGNAVPKVAEFTHNPILQKIGFNVFKGHNFYNHHSQQVDFVLLEPARINIMNNWLAE